jgi:anti-sigma B factor antagonist
MVDARDALSIGVEATTMFTLSGDVDMATAPHVDAALAPAVRRGGAIILDVSDVAFMDSSGIHVIVRALEALPSGCITLHGVRGPVARLLELTRLADVPGLHVETCSAERNSVRDRDVGWQRGSSVGAAAS